ncbi:zf-HC2 domain-containing protein [Lentzea sp. NBC_00516]|uniref:zf-HC2 domain-containing protein n=1 Tax=Lentzea sp. NBC_00516 TaxID=2903582 RepID=UPI002E808124|nr:zf-HC2 domain-containing protein [Lentzea sp. NBC_00516]WUD20821.1 zf-HC2 domain-containing protein [Lentzea sp. NBC_00516]
MVTRQPHHEHVGAGAGQDQDDENRTSPEGPCGDVAGYALGVLDPAEHVMFSRHLAGCEDCRRDVADFGTFAPMLRPVLRENPPGARQPCPIARSILLVAAGVVVAIAAVLSVVESLSSHADPVDVGSLTRAQSTHAQPFELLGRV